MNRLEFCQPFGKQIVGNGTLLYQADSETEAAELAASINALVERHNERKRPSLINLDDVMMQPKD
jgi:hypothetical protein